MNVLSDIVKRILPAQQFLLFVISRALLKGEKVQEGRDHLTINRVKSCDVSPTGFSVAPVSL